MRNIKLYETYIIKIASSTIFLIRKKEEEEEDIFKMNI